jgi:hypothetical protein
MNVVLIETHGYALEAEIEVNGVRLTVMDRISTVERAAEPGPVADPSFDVVIREPRSWEQAFSGNPDREKKLERQWGWRYLGYGPILAVDPVRVDLGVLVLALDFSVEGPRRAGEWVAIAIDRIVLSHAS